MTKKYYIEYCIEIYENCEIKYDGVYHSPVREHMLAVAAEYDRATFEMSFDDYSEACQVFLKKSKDIKSRKAWLSSGYSSKVWNFDYIDFISRTFDEDGNEIDFEFIDCEVSAEPLPLVYEDK